MKNLILLLLCFPLIGFGQGWNQLGIDIDGEAVEDRFGHAVAINGNGTVIAAGALSNDQNGANSGHVKVYEYISGVWTQKGQDIDGEAAGDGSGSSVALNNDGNIVAIGAPYNSGNGVDAGHVRVYQYVSSSGQWTQIGLDIDGEFAGDECGRSVSLNYSGTILAVGAPKNSGNGNASGHVRVYEYTGLWNQIGSDIDGEAADDLSGYSVSISGDGVVVAIAAKENDGSALDAGHVRVYENSGGNWIQTGQDIDGEASGDDFGREVSLNDNGNILAVGASGNDDAGFNAGHARVYENILGTWTQIGQDIDGEATSDYFGKSVSLNSTGTVLAVGGYMNDANNQSTPNKGHTRVFNNVGGSWFQIGQDIDGDAANNYSGAAVCLSNSGDRVIIGAPFNADNGTASGHVRVFENTSVPSSIQNINFTNNGDSRIVDILYREVNESKNKVLFYINDNGTVEKKIIFK